VSGLETIDILSEVLFEISLKEYLISNGGGAKGRSLAHNRDHQRDDIRGGNDRLSPRSCVRRDSQGTHIFFLMLFLFGFSEAQRKKNSAMLLQH
jgi:hypothetical protein